MQTVGQIVRKRREALGLTLSAVAGAVGATKGYLSMIENHRVDNPPSRGVLEGLERALGITTGDLQRAADWQSTPEPVRQQVQRLSDDAQRGRELARWIRRASSRRAGAEEGGRADDDKSAASPTAAGPADKAEGGGGKLGGAGLDLDAWYRSGQLARRVQEVLHDDADNDAERDGGGRGDGGGDVLSGGGGGLGGGLPSMVRYRVPIINQVAAGLPTEHTDLGFPDGTADQHLDVPELAGPDCFATRIAGRSMQPGYGEGDIVVCSASAKVEDGSDCFVRLEPDHESTFKRVYFDQGAGTIRLQPLNPDFEARVVKREQVAGMYRAVWKFSKV